MLSSILLGFCCGTLAHFISHKHRWPAWKAVLLSVVFALLANMLILVSVAL